MGNRGMSTHGFQITFAVENLHVGDVDGTITKHRYLVTVQMDVVYSQSSEQTLPEVRRLHCLFFVIIPRDTSYLLFPNRRCPL